MKSRLFHHFAFLLFINLFLIHSQVNAQWAAVSYYSLIKGATDILIIKVDRIAGEPYGEKAIAHVERSFKEIIHGDSIKLPFVYTSWPTGKKNEMVSVSETMPVSFEVGKRYVVLIRKSRQTIFNNPHGAKTEYEVINYPKETIFDFTDDKDPRILEIEQLLKRADENDPKVRIDSLLSMIHSNSKETRNNAIEALIDLKSEKAAEAFIALLRNDSDSNVRYSAALGLGYLHVDSIVKALLECLQTEKAKVVRYQIIGSLGMIRAKIAAPMLLGLYEMEEYDVRNAILQTISSLGDSTVIPSLIHLFLIDQDLQHRHSMAQTIASFHTLEADEFSSALLDTAKKYWLKSAVIDGWSGSTYTKGFDKIARWTSIPCASDDHLSKAKAEIQGLAFPLLRAIEKLGTPDQIASTLKVYSACSDPAIRDMAVRILKKQMVKNITVELHKEIEEEIKTFSSH
jgi:hypothetical protein